MNLGEFAKGITFRFFQPEERSFDVVNTELPCDDTRLKALLGDVCQIPRMSSFAIGALLQRAIACMPEEQAYVNIGVWNGFSLLAGMAGNPEKTCIGVDDFSQFGGPREAFLSAFAKRKSPRHCFFEMDFREYFAREHHEPIGVYFYDGGHDYDNQLAGLEAAEPFFAPGCKIFVDDTNWPTPRRAMNEFLARSACRYEVLFDQHTSGNGHPTFWNGLMILERT